MFEKSWERWYVSLHGVFWLLLLILLILNICGCLNSFHTFHNRKVALSTEQKSRIGNCVQENIQELLRAVKDVVISGLGNITNYLDPPSLVTGKPDSRVKTLKKETKLFKLTKNLLEGCLVKGEPQRDQLTHLQRCLKKQIMTSPYRLRGSRRAAVLFGFVQVNVINLTLDPRP